jgi:hypothetical protein
MDGNEFGNLTEKLDIGTMLFAMTLHWMNGAAQIPDLTNFEVNTMKMALGVYM